MKWLRHPALYWVVSIGLGAVFIYASLDKIAHPLDFARIVYDDFAAQPLAARVVGTLDCQKIGVATSGDAAKDAVFR